jgi:transcriptional regulator with XRE-family HTH domain
MVNTEGQRKLVAFVEARGLSYAEAARQLSVTRAVFGEWISGSQRPRAEHRAAIEKWTGGEVPAGSWLTLDEQAQIDAVLPFMAAAGPSAA